MVFKNSFVMPLREVDKVGSFSKYCALRNVVGTFALYCWHFTLSRTPNEAGLPQTLRESSRMTDWLMLGAGAGSERKVTVKMIPINREEARKLSRKMYSLRCLL